MFEIAKRNIGMHIKNIVGRKSGFLPETIEILVNKQTTKTYNLDVIEEICKHSKSASGYDFIKWVDELINNDFNNKASDLSPYKANNYEIVTFKNDEVMLDIRVSPNEDTVWLTQNEIALLFNTSRKNISTHINNIYDEKELEKRATIQESWTVQIEEKQSIQKH